MRVTGVMGAAGAVLCVLFGAAVVVAGAGAFRLDTGSGVAMLVIGVNLAPWAAAGGFALLLADERRHADRTRAGRLVLVPARIESVRAVGEGPDIPLLLELTVAPGGSASYRARARTAVNLVDVGSYRVGTVIPVDHDPEQPWRVTVCRRPPVGWAARTSLLKIDAAPAATLRTAPPRRGLTGGRIGLLAAAAGGLSTCLGLLSLR
ncbi:hypothetical protein [Kitasatospora paranensis]|uniref:Uncharacterized protein n=1 Tax=Kitasatospora paranensis TaxID=258053 RepID=A0ABW2G145_9ACTN